MYILRDEEEIDDPRREFLVDALTAGAFVATGTAGLMVPASTAEASIFGKVPRKVPPGKSIFDIKGAVRVNGKAADKDTLIKVNDTVETGKKSQVVFVVGKDAFIMRSNSKLKLSGTGLLLNNLRLVTGKLLSVFGKRKKKERGLSVATSTATIGIRGTGVYFEAEPDRSYICTCYGVTSLASTTDPSSRESIASKRHDAPRYILAKGAKGKRIRKAPFKNHTDMELMLIEELVGRTTPYSVSDVDYNAPRRGY